MFQRHLLTTSKQLIRFNSGYTRVANSKLNTGFNFGDYTSFFKKAFTESGWKNQSINNRFNNFKDSFKKGLENKKNQFINDKYFKKLMEDEVGLATLGWKYGWRIGGFAAPFYFYFDAKHQYNYPPHGLPLPDKKFQISNSDLTSYVFMGVPTGMFIGGTGCFTMGYMATALYDIVLLAHRHKVLHRCFPYAIMFTVPFILYSKFDA